MRCMHFVVGVCLSGESYIICRSMVYELVHQNVASMCQAFIAFFFCKGEGMCKQTIMVKLQYNKKSIQYTGKNKLD